ncbi:HAD family hydrolase [Hyphomicrobium album]|uniref:HAD family hydrolase n=1 Tax=Hyphomicrobium album TaxID=2665159 RepID=UPI0012B72D5C|nr:HAD family phosphatase [Hyphomicrobium album]
MNGKGLLLDLDGTLADSVPALRAVYFAFLSGLGATGTDDEFGRLNGPPLAEIIRVLKKAHGLRDEPAALLRRYSDMIRHAHQTAPPVGGATELLQEARTRGWKIAVVTSSARSAAWDWLVRSGLSDRVDAVVGGDEVANGKPAPDPYVLGLSRVNCAAAVSLAVEDSRLGAMSAVAAGLSTWVVADPTDRSGWPAEVGFVSGLPDLLEILRTC